MQHTTQRIDIGRLTIVTIFSLLMVANMIGIYRDSKAVEPLSTIKIATMIHHLLIVCFYGLFVLLYLMRRAARSTTKSLVVKAVAVIATFVPFAIPVLSRPVNDPCILFFADLVTTIGMIIALYSLSALGRSLSIIPQARSLVRTGLYKVVRHPVYLGELIAILGIVLARFSLSALAVFCLLTALQIYRALQEEKLLAGVFPEYGSYSLKVARFIPGIF